MSTTAIQETPLLMQLQGEQLVGVLSAPAGPSGASGTGVVIVVGGPQVRCGSHRLLVQMARALAGAGHAVLRFDVRGMGDSTGEPRSFEALDDDIATAMATLRTQQPALQRVVLCGLCDGASAALLHLHARCEAAVDGLLLLNPWVRSPQSLAQARLKHYYWQRLGERAFWQKLLRGGVGLGALAAWWCNWRAARQAPAATHTQPFPERMASGWRQHPVPTLLVLAGRDITAQEFLTHAGQDAAWQGWLQEPLVTRVDLPSADHTFSALPQKQALIDAVLRWLPELERP